MSKYDQTHKLGKLCMMIVVMLLLLIDGSLTIFNGLAIAVWVWGTNAFSYLIEHLRGWKHRHDKF